jgi:hypothetical protein
LSNKLEKNIMNDIELCLQNKIVSSNNKLQPTIFKSILNLYQKGFLQITARMVKEECIKIDQNINWNQRLNAICNSMEKTIECGVRIISENRPHNNFTIVFDGDATNLDIKIPKKSFLKTDSKKKKATNITSELSLKHIKNELNDINLSENFKVVFICANKKNNSHFTNYQNVKFLATTALVNEYRPDDCVPGENKTWKKYLVEEQLDTNLKKAYQLYTRNEYSSLYNKFKKSFYILSAGWGLVNSEFRLPKYDITFSIGNKVPLNTRRNKNLILSPVYDDFNQLNANDKEDIIFIGGKEYLNLFFKLTQNLDNRKIIFYFGANNLPMPNRNKKSFIFINYPSNNNRGWHYEVARYFCNYIIP